MRSISITLLAGLCVLASGYSVPGNKFKNADKDFLLKQKKIFEVLQHVHRNELQPELKEIARTFEISDNYNQYKNVQAVKEFYSLYKHGLLPENEIFTIYNEYHREQAISLFKLFYYANDWETFYKSVVWARYHVNEGLFVYALTVAVIHRTDLAGLELPAPYEIYPFYFFNSDVIQKAQQYKMQGFHNLKKVDGVYTVVIQSNYTESNEYSYPEQKIAYLTEDIGWNTYYYYFQADYPFWMEGKEFGLNKDRRGEFTLFRIQQILARYYLERLSNDLGKIPQLSWRKHIKTGYYPSLSYYNGVHFPSRETNYHLYNEKNYYDVETVEDYERRIRDAIDHGFIVLTDGTFIDLTKPESIEYLGNIIQNNPDSPNRRFYGFVELFARVLLGRSYVNVNDYETMKKVIPGALSHFETSLRDPIFYQLYKRIIRYYWQFKNKLPQYKYEELAFEGVTIESAEVDKLITYFDYHDSDITNAIDVEILDKQIWKNKESDLYKFGRISQYEGEDIVIKARQYRLNHLPFTIKLTINSEKTITSVVRIYLGPKYDEYGHIYDINENRENFVLLDTFKYELKTGKTVITRDSQDFTWYIKDRTTFLELYKWVLTAYNGENTFPLDQTESHSGIPSRLLLPKGKRGGLEYQFFFIVSPYTAPAIEQYTGFDPIITSGIGSGSRFVDTKPFGYPFDRKINSTAWYTPNMYYYDAIIYQKKEAEVNAADAVHDI